MANKKAPRKYQIHKKLEEPVHSYIGYGTLLVLAILTFVFIYFLKQMY